LGKNVRVSPRKASIVLDTIRGKRVKDAQNILKFSKRAIAQDIYKILSSAAANAENNHQLDLDILKVSEAYCGKGMVMKRWRARAKGRPGRIEKFLSNITIKVAEVQNDKEESK
jgi:large subunit ribosomal protein L22